MGSARGLEEGVEVSSVLVIIKMSRNSIKISLEALQVETPAAKKKPRKRPPPKRPSRAKKPPVPVGSHSEISGSDDPKNKRELRRKKATKETYRAMEENLFNLDFSDEEERLLMKGGPAKAGAAA